MDGLGDSTGATNEFADALSAAVSQRGLALNRLAFRLANSGFPITTATLSNWQRGRSIPRGSYSIPLLGALELLLAIDPGSLVSLARTSAADKSSTGTRVPALIDEEFAHAAAIMGLPGRETLRHVAQTRRYAIGHPAPLGAAVFSSVWRVESGSVSCAWVDVPAMVGGPADIVGLSMGRIADDPYHCPSGRVIARLELPVRLTQGELLHTSVAVHPQESGQPWTEVLSPAGQAADQVVLIVEFQRTLPASLRCVAVEAATPPREIESDEVEPFRGQVQVIHHQGSAFGFGFRWSW